MKPHLLKGQLKPIISCPTSHRLYYLLRLYQCVSLFQSNVSAKLVRVFAALCHNLDHHRFFAMQVLIKMVSPNTGYKKKGPYQCSNWERSRRNQSRLFPPVCSISIPSRSGLNPSHFSPWNTVKLIVCVLFI